MDRKCDEMLDETGGGVNWNDLEERIKEETTWRTKLGNGISENIIRY